MIYINTLVWLVKKAFKTLRSVYIRKIKTVVILQHEHSDVNDATYYNLKNTLKFRKFSIIWNNGLEKLFYGVLKISSAKYSDLKNLYEKYYYKELPFWIIRFIWLLKICVCTSRCRRRRWIQSRINIFC